MTNTSYTNLLRAAEKLIESANKGGIDDLCESIRDLREAVNDCRRSEPTSQSDREVGK